MPAESSPKDGTATLGNNYCNICSFPLVLRQCHGSHPEPFSLACRMRSDPGRPSHDAGLSPHCRATPRTTGCLRNPKKLEGFFEVIINLKRVEPCWKSRRTLPKMGGSSALPPLSGDVQFLFGGQGRLTYAPHWRHMLSRKGTICALQPCKRWDSQAAAGLGAQKPGARILPPTNDHTCTLRDSGSQCPGPVELRSCQVPAEQETASSLSFLPSFSPFDDCTEMLVDWDCYTHASLKQPCSGTDDSS